MSWWNKAETYSADKLGIPTHGNIVAPQQHPGTQPNQTQTQQNPAMQTATCWEAARTRKQANRSCHFVRVLALP